MQNPTFYVYYDTTNSRPRKSFGRDSRAAMAWAQDNAHRNTTVVKEQEVWDARTDGYDPERGASAPEANR